MTEFLQVITPDEVRDILYSCVPLGTEKIPLSDASGRVLAMDIMSPEDIPGFNRSTMDGFAVRAKDTFGANESLPIMIEVIGSVQMGNAPHMTILENQAVSIPTGGMLPQGTDAVVMIEHSIPLDNMTIEIIKPVKPFENMLMKGDDVKSGDHVLSNGHFLRSQDIGMLASLGFSKVSVFRRPRVAILSTGDEIVPLTVSPGPAQVRDVNGYCQLAQVTASGGIPVYHGIIPDDLDALKKISMRAIKDADIMLISGGSSVGSRDYTLNVIDSLPCSKILVHGIAVKPGKPTILGRFGAKYIWGLPGHPVSAMIIYSLFVDLQLHILQGDSRRLPFDNSKCVEAELKVNIPSVHGREDYVRVVLEEKENKRLAQPVFGKSGVMSTMVKADGYIAIPLHSEGLDAGSKVMVHLF